jgi:fido (protein-threonine AMPylation protein)
VIYAILRAIFDSFVEWASKPREVRMVGGGKRFADRVRAEIRRRTR